MDADGQHKTQLTNTPRQEEVPAWTADGRIVYCGQAADDLDNWDIYLMNADGSGLRRLTSSPAFDCWPAPAPSGNKLAYTTVRNDVAGIVTMNLNGTEHREVTTGMNRAAWRRTVAIGQRSRLRMRQRNAHGQGRVDGPPERQGLTQLTNTPSQREAFPAFSPARKRDRVRPHRRLRCLQHLLH